MHKHHQHLAIKYQRAQISKQIIHQNFLLKEKCPPSGDEYKSMIEYERNALTPATSGIPKVPSDLWTRGLYICK